MPANATAVSFGLNLFTNGTLTTDDLSMIQAGAPPPPRPPLRPRPRSPPRPSAPSRCPPHPAGKTTKPGKHKGDQITTHNIVPAPAQPRTGGGRSGRNPQLGIAPGAVVLPPFVVSPELTRG